MHVLHISLGLPPLRTGGLTRYCCELMQAQATEGYEVSLLYPGRFLPGKTRLVSSRWNGVTTFEVINPLPVALTYGISEPKAFIAPCDNSQAYESFLKAEKPDVIHVHSYMGVHKEFFEAAKTCGIRMVFTTHDYYPMCPRCTLVNQFGENCDEGPSASRCAKCNQAGGMSRRKSVVMQSALYRAFKGSGLFDFVAGRVKRNMRGSERESEAKEEKRSVDIIALYENLLAYNRSIFSLFDCVICNSSMTEQQYRARFSNMTYCKVPITHAGLDRTQAVSHGNTKSSKLRIGYFGGSKRYKGIDVLMDAISQLDNRNLDFVVELYGDEYSDIQDGEHVKKFGRVLPSDMQRIIGELDLVVVPSVYHETFGFVVLEALCAGTPVICSDAVGAGELVDENLRFKSGSSRALASRISYLCRGGNRIVSLDDTYPLTMKQQVSYLSTHY